MEISQDNRISVKKNFIFTAKQRIKCVGAEYKILRRWYERTLKWNPYSENFLSRTNYGDEMPSDLYMILFCEFA